MSEWVVSIPASPCHPELKDNWRWLKIHFCPQCQGPSAHYWLADSTDSPSLETLSANHNPLGNNFGQARPLTNFDDNDTGYTVVDWITWRSNEGGVNWTWMCLYKHQPSLTWGWGTRHGHQLHIMVWWPLGLVWTRGTRWSVRYRLNLLWTTGPGHWHRHSLHSGQINVSTWKI